MSGTHENDTVSDLYDYWTGPGSDVARAIDHDGTLQSATIDWRRLRDYDTEIARRFIREPGDLREKATEALRLVAHSDKNDLLDNIKNVTVRMENIPDDREYRVGKCRSRQLGELIRLQGEVVEAGAIEPVAVEAAFECQRCGTLTRRPQPGGKLEEPHECQGCERQGWFKFNMSHSQLKDQQEILLVPTDSSKEDPPAQIVFLREDLCDRVAEGDQVSVCGRYNAFTDQNEVRLETRLDAWSLPNIDEGTWADEYALSDLLEFVVDAIKTLRDDTYRVPRHEVVEYVASDYGRETEIEDAIDKGIEENVIVESGNELYLMQE